MTKTAWTPGPWEAIKGLNESDEMRCGVVADRGVMKYLVATIENGAPGDICDTEYANARLIASAPELFEALAGMVRYTESVRMLDGMGKTQQARFEVAKAVLAKARGGQ